MKLVLILSLLISLTAASDSTPEEKSPGGKGSLRGLVAGSIFEVQPIRWPFPSRTCVANEVELKAGIDRGGSVVICNNTQIKLTSPIDLTSKSADVRCESPVVGKLNWQINRNWDQLRCGIFGNRNFRLMEGAPNRMTFDSIVFYGGSAGFERGGAAFLYGGTTTFDNCLFSDNNGGQGGAISVYNNYTTVTIRNTEFQYSYATSVRNGKAQGGYGGAILVENAHVELIDSGIRFNDGYTDGGAIAVLGGKMSIVGSRILHNYFNYGTDVAEAIYARNAKIYLSDSFVAGNISEYGSVSEPVTSINIADDEDPNGVGTYVNCSSTVNFCSGLDTVKEKATWIPSLGEPSYQIGKKRYIQFYQNTNCRTVAIQNSYDPQCYHAFN